MSAAGGLNVERVVLRAAVGDKNYADVEQVALLLDRLLVGGALTEDGVSHVIETLADEIVIAAVVREVANDLSSGADVPDTHTPEDNPE